MDYDLCKQLKDAGYPQGCLPVFCDKCKQAQYNDEGIDACNCFMAIQKKYNYEMSKECYGETDLLTETFIPNLSELIEACGEDFISLNKVIDPDGWSCDFSDENDQIIGETFGITPEEAVALLYLAIHSQELKDSKDMID